MVRIKRTMRVEKTIIYAFALAGLLLGGCQCSRTGPDVSQDFNIPDSLKDKQEVELSEGSPRKWLKIYLLLLRQLRLSNA